MQRSSCLILVLGASTRYIGPFLDFQFDHDFGEGAPLPNPVLGLGLTHRLQILQVFQPPEKLTISFVVNIEMDHHPLPPGCQACPE